MAISSVGVGSGLDVDSIVSQIGKIERAPIKRLETQYKSTEQKISTYGKIKSLVDDLNSAARKLSFDSGWNGTTVSSSSSAVSAATTGIVAPGSYNLNVLQLAQSQTSVSGKMAGSMAMGIAGVLRLNVGEPSTARAFDINVSGADTLETLVAKINSHAEASKSISASVITDGQGQQQLMLRSRETGLTNQFTVDVGSGVSNGQLQAIAPQHSHTGLAKLAGQSTTQSEAVTTGGTISGGGTITLNLGNGHPPQTVQVDLQAGDDTLQKVADRINNPSGLGKYVQASVVTDGGQERLTLRLRGDNGFSSVSISITDGVTGTADTRLQSLNGKALSLGVTQAQQAQNAKMTFNGVEVESSGNTFSSTIPGMSVTVSKAGESAVLMAAQDHNSIRDNIRKFVDAYNALNDLLAESTKYDEEKKVAGILQGDSATVNLQNSLRMMTQGFVANATGKFQYLSQAGVVWSRSSATKAGRLMIDEEKLNVAMRDVDSLKSLFAAKPDTLGRGGGIGANFKALTDDLLSWEGAINRKVESLETINKRNLTQQSDVEKRALRAEQRLRAQYTALDAKMASIKGLSSYVDQMVTAWNKSSSK